MERDSILERFLEEVERRIGYARMRGQYFAEDRPYWQGYEDALDFTRRLLRRIRMELIEETIDAKAEEAYSLFYDRKEEVIE